MIPSIDRTTSPARKLKSLSNGFSLKYVHLGINYTPLLYEPTGFSIETKCVGEDWAEASHQISVWLAAYWKRRDGLLRGSAGRSAELSDVSFLPGIIIQGHDWFFIAATCRSDSSGAEMGTTAGLVRNYLLAMVKAGHRAIGPG